MRCGHKYNSAPTLFGLPSYKCFVIPATKSADEVKLYQRKASLFYIVTVHMGTGCSSFLEVDDEEWGRRKREGKSVGEAEGGRKGETERERD